MKTTAILGGASAIISLASAVVLPHKYVRRQSNYTAEPAGSPAQYGNSGTFASLRNNVRIPIFARLGKCSRALLQIKHVIYLMMENHSFDNIAGYWDFRDDIDGLRNIEFCNEYVYSPRESIPSN